MFAIRLPVRYSHLLRSLLAAAVLVLFWETVFELARFGPRDPSSRAAGIAFNVLLLMSLVELACLVTNRSVLSIVVCAGAYSVLGLANLAKLRVLQAPLHPQDLEYITDIGLVLGSHWLALCGLAAAGAVGWLAVRFPGQAQDRQPLRRRVSGAAAALLLLTATVCAYREGPHQDSLRRLGLESVPWLAEFSARRNGLLAELLLELHTRFPQAPQRYSAAEIGRIARTYFEPSAGKKVGKPKVNLIIYMVEAFMDPTELGLRFTQDPIPNFRALTRRYGRGRLISPVFGGKSANSEFEVVTGMSTYFTPAESCPYKQFIHRPTPGLPEILSRLGYRTAALHVESLSFYNYREVYPLLGYRTWHTLQEDPAAMLRLDTAGQRPSDDELVKAVIHSSRASGPFFVFAFANSTHWPWNYAGRYAKSRLDVLEPGLTAATRRELKTYVNALYTADRALGKLVEHFSRRREKTVILMLGDHLPGLDPAIYDLSMRRRGVPRGGATDGRLPASARGLTVPGLLWSNFPLPRRDFTASNNLLLPRILRSLGLRPRGLPALLEQVTQHFAVLSDFVETSDGRRFQAGDPRIPHRKLIQDYRLAQYDLLRGEQYLLRPKAVPAP